MKQFQKLNWFGWITNTSTLSQIILGLYFIVQPVLLLQTENRNRQLFVPHPDVSELEEVTNTLMTSHLKEKQVIFPEDLRIRLVSY